MVEGMGYRCADGPGFVHGMVVTILCTHLPGLLHLVGANGVKDVWPVSYHVMSVVMVGNGACYRAQVIQGSVGSL